MEFSYEFDVTGVNDALQVCKGAHKKCRQSGLAAYSVTSIHMDGLVKYRVMCSCALRARDATSVCFSGSTICRPSLLPEGGRMLERIHGVRVHMLKRGYKTTCSIEVLSS